MDSVTILTLAVVCYAACTALASVQYSSWPSKQRQRSESSRESKDALLVIAHPDDESMFFVPTILALAAAGRRVRILCLSTGSWNAGHTARKLLYMSHGFPITVILAK